jgi:hypothetical protein
MQWRGILALSLKATLDCPENLLVHDGFKPVRMLDRGRRMLLVRLLPGNDLAGFGAVVVTGRILAPDKGIRSPMERRLCTDR